MDWYATNRSILEGAGNFVFDSLVDEANRLAGTDFPGCDPAFWPTVNRLLATGQIEQAMGASAPISTLCGFSCRPIYDAVTDVLSCDARLLC